MSTQVQPSPAAPRRPGTAKPPPERIVIQYPTPAVDDGRYPAKRVVGDSVRVEADIFRDGHEILRAVIRYRPPRARDWRETEMARIDAHLGGVRWAGSFEVDCQGRWEYTV
ncbi:MAG TPA: maltotransferase domain-containing protein, partial [Solirubrobacteraceae bacterium]|nr:maltotransferase domain-containing protein [Solirubrobacteraceae bacterium]